MIRCEYCYFFIIIVFILISWVQYIYFEMNLLQLNSHAPNAKPRAVLTAEDAVQIFRRSPRCDMSSSATAMSLGREYGVSEKAVRDIWTARTWAKETRHLDPQRPPRVSKLPGRPLGKRDGVPRRRKHNDRGDAKIKKIEPRTSSSASGLDSFMQIPVASDGVCLGQQSSVQSFFGYPGIQSEQGGSIDGGKNVDYVPITNGAASSQRINSSLFSNVPAPLVSDFRSPIASHASTSPDFARNSVQYCERAKATAVGVDKDGECRWEPLISTLWDIGKGTFGSSHSTLSLSAPKRTIHFASMSASWNTGFSDITSGDGCWSGLDEGGSSLDELRRVSGGSDLSGSNLISSILDVGLHRIGRFSGKDDCGEAESCRGAGFCNTSWPSQDDIGSEHSMQFPPPAVRAQFAPSNACDLIRQTTSAAHGVSAPRATRIAVRERRGWAMDLDLGRPGDSTTNQDRAPARAPQAAARAGASAARAGAADPEGLQQDPPQGCLWSATPRGGAQSTWQLEPEHRTSAFDPPPKRLRAEESRSLRQIQQQMQHERQELYDELPHQQQHLLLPHLRQVRQYAQQLEERPSPHCQRSPQQQGHVHNPILPQCEEVQDLHRHGWPSHGREQRHDGSSWRRMGSTGRAGLP